MLDKKKVKVPHMGWNSIQLVAHKRGLPKKTGVAKNESENVRGGGRRGSRLLHNVEDNSWVYFVHSYRILPEKPERKIVIANSQYGDNMIPAVIEKGSIFGTQFHPEKSGPVGSQIMKNFLKICSSPVMAEVT
jgi:imidazole glycerol-phosphate synthase subunit HisH